MNKALFLMVLAAVAWPALAAESRPGLKPCRLQGLENDAWCGVLQRPLDPAQPQGKLVDIHYAVIPALARNRKPDPVLFFAGGPGQSAMDLAGPVSRMLARLSNRRDLVLVDQRGTGRSAPLLCEDTPPTAPLAEAVDTARQQQKLRACRERLQTLPHGNLRHYTTWVAMQDADAVRAELGAAKVNVIGGSYGTRAALEYLRQFPQAVRRMVIDGVAPPDMVMPAAFSTDNQAALEAVFSACESEPACRTRHPALRADWRALMASMPQDVGVLHPVTGEPQRLRLTRDALVALVRGPLYAPILASALPQAMADAARGRFEGLVGLAGALGGGRLGRISEGMHFSVVCSEDVPRLDQATDAPGADFGNSFATLYRDVCKDWPRGSVPAAFYTLPQATAPVLVLSGGADPVTPPRHGERVARALGAKARHVVVPQAGHGVMTIGCLRDALFRFIDADSDDEAMKVDAGCAASMPRPPAFRPVTAPTGAEAAK
jgi:pimeloyl-ACP methyl ester carboxylesterase